MTNTNTVTVEDVLAEVENIVHRRTGQHVFRDGRDGSFTDDGATIGAAIVGLLDEARKGEPGFSRRIEHEPEAYFAEARILARVKAKRQIAEEA